MTPPTEWAICPFHWITGLDCPLCGLTRGLCALAKGHWTEAVQWNALTPVAALMLIALCARGRWVGHAWTVGIAAFGVYGLYRVIV